MTEPTPADAFANVQSFVPLLADIHAAIQAFGPLRFSERHHAWLRHIRIETVLDVERNKIIVQFRGACTRFLDLAISPTNPRAGSFAVWREKHALEDFLEKNFLRDHSLSNTDLNSFSQLDNHYHVGAFNYAHAIQQFVYWDYKFAKAAAQRAPPQDS